MPTRTCIGCRAAADKSDLTRIVALSGAAVCDPEQVLPGRGAYLHPLRSCLDQALRRRAFARALRQPVSTKELAVGVIPGRGGTLACGVSPVGGGQKHPESGLTLMTTR